MMRRVTRWSAGVLAVVLAVVLGLGATMRGDLSVPALVTQDSDLPAAEIGGYRLHLRLEEGPPGAGTVIVLHGGPGGDFRSLTALARLSDTRSVVFYDQRGAGLSERVPASVLTLDGHLEELAAVIDHVAPGKEVSLIGHSWGAMLALAYLGRDPARIASVVLIEPGYLDADGRRRWQEESRRFMSGPAWWATAVANGVRAARVSGPDAQAGEDFLVGRMVRTFADHPLNPYHCGRGYDAPAWRFGAASNDAWNAAEPDEVDRIGRGAERWDGAVLLMAGACDDWLGPPLQRRHLARFANARLAVIPEAGHDVVWDNPDAALAAIRAFLDAPHGRAGP